MPRTAAQIATIYRDTWDIYNRDIPRIKLTANLHAAGFAFGTPVLHVQREGRQVDQVPVVAEPGLLRAMGIMLYVGGQTRAAVDAGESEVRLRQGEDDGEGCAFAFTESYGENEPAGALCSLGDSHDALLGLMSTDPAQAARLLDNSGLLAADLLSTQPASRLKGDGLATALSRYSRRVSQMKEQFIRHLSPCVPFRVLATSWVPPWEPPVSRNSGLLGTGHVYQVFLNEGIDLVNLKQDALAVVDAELKMRTMGPDEARAIIASFGG